MKDRITDLSSTTLAEHISRNNPDFPDIEVLKEMPLSALLHIAAKIAPPQAYSEPLDASIPEYPDGPHYPFHKDTPHRSLKE